MKRHYAEMFKAIILGCALLAGLAAPTTLLAVPINAGQAKSAVETFLTTRFPAVKQSGARTFKVTGSSRLAVVEAAPLLDNNITVGYITTLEPSGYVLVRADDEVPPVKIYTENGTFDSLPPEFLKVIKLELTEELQSLSVLKQRNASIGHKFKDQWSALLNPVEQQALLNLPTSSPGVVLLTTAWNQDAAYNYYCPTAIGGPGGRAYTGCTATALAQILRYHSAPIQVSQDHTYTDNRGSCTGSHSISDAGMGTYDWANMPASIATSSPLSEQQAIGQLMYHAGVALESNFEGYGTSAFPSAVPGVLSTYFGYTSGPIEGKSSFTSSQWYSKISTDIDMSEPVFYAMWQADGSAGHAVVCDGYRNGNEIHLNMGWSGSGNLWYNIDTVSFWVYTWTVHAAVFEIKPPGGSETNCFDGIDNDNDGLTDCADSDCNGYTDGACSTGNHGICSAGTYTCSGSAEVCVQNNQPAAEVCDGLDNDCDGSVDEGCNVDLYISSMSAPDSASAGDHITVGATVNKSGSGSAAASTARIYIYGQITGTATNYFMKLGDVAVSSFGAGSGSKAVSVSVTIPSWVVPGSHSIIVIADVNDVVPEWNENNNRRSKPVTIVP